ncbi:hypothetical protein ACFSCW_15895 [Sphingomonas tabacisoli]|uniref:Uncharacterized protein n=1 Tax=Sphingomonas tabacisoli TaxID=2249466 RepID=A0ABW4I5N2_9SPHN
MSDYKPGSRWKSAVGTGEFVVVRPPSGEGELTCGGAAVLAHNAAAGPASDAPAGSEGTAAGKRYAETESGIEILCSKAGTGDLAFAGRPLARKDAKPLPASD